MKMAFQLLETTVCLHKIPFWYALLFSSVIAAGQPQPRTPSVTSRSDHDPRNSVHLARQQSINSSMANQGQSDSLQLLSVPWMDIMNLSFDGG